MHLSRIQLGLSTGCQQLARVGMTYPYPDPADPMRARFPNERDTQVFGGVPALDLTAEQQSFADELFLVMFDDRQCRLTTHPKVAALALAAALLAELAEGGWIYVQHEFVFHIRQRIPPRDLMTHTLLDEISRQEQRLPVREWIISIADGSTSHVEQRLVRTNVLFREERRRWLRGPVVEYRPVDEENAAWPRSRLSTTIRQGRDLDDFDVVLAGLCHGGGVLRSVLDGYPARHYEGLLSHLDRRLRGKPAVWAIARELEDTVRAAASVLA